MPVRSFQEHVQALLGRSVAEAKVAGASVPDIEARAVLESIALTLLLKPKAVLYLAHMARNGLKKAVTDEIALITQISKTIDDLANITLTSLDTTQLNKARTSLVQMEGLDKIDTRDGTYKRFSNSVDAFLNQALGKTVRKKGATELTRADAEAAIDLPADLASLVAAHDDTLARFYALVVGVENFTSSPLGTMLGLATAFRARSDIDDIMGLVEAGESGAQARDIVVRLIGTRAALKTVGSLPDINAALVDTSTEVPAGYVLRAQTDAEPAVATSNASSAFFFGPAASAAITVNGVLQTATNFPQTGLDLESKPFVVTEAGKPYPITVPVGTSIFLRFSRDTASAGYDLQTDGSYLKQVKVQFTAGLRTLAQVIADINTALGADGTALEYVAPGTGRILIAGNAFTTKLSVEGALTEASLSTVGDVHYYTDSSHSLFGFDLTQSLAGDLPLEIILDAFNIRFPSINATRTGLSEVQVETVATIPGTVMTIATESGLGLNGVFAAKSDSLRLYGTVNGVVTDPVNPNPLVDISDIITTPGGDTTISGLSLTRLRLTVPIHTFDGHVVISSSLLAAFNVFDTNLQDLLSTWLAGEFAEDLTTVDRAVAVLTGSVTPASRNGAKAVLQRLDTLLDSLNAALASGPLPNECGTDEKTLVNGIINTLVERRYDRALDFLLKLKLREFFELTGDTTSFGGTMLKSMSNMANSDISFPNTAQDDESLKAVVKGSTT